MTEWLVEWRNDVGSLPLSQLSRNRRTKYWSWFWACLICTILIDILQKKPKCYGEVGEIYVRVLLTCVCLHFIRLMCSTWQKTFTRVYKKSCNDRLLHICKSKFLPVVFTSLQTKLLFRQFPVPGQKLWYTKYFFWHL